LPDMEKRKRLAIEAGLKSVPKGLTLTWKRCSSKKLPICAEKHDPMNNKQSS